MIFSYFCRVHNMNLSQRSKASGVVQRRVLSLLIRDQLCSGGWKLGGWFIYKMQPGSWVLHAYVFWASKPTRQVQNSSKEIPSLTWTWNLRAIITLFSYLYFMLNSPFLILVLFAFIFSLASMLSLRIPQLVKRFQTVDPAGGPLWN